MNHSLSEKIEKWLSTVISITTATVSLSKVDDIFTGHDCKRYDIVKYTNGETKWNLTSFDKPSDDLHIINKILEAWGLSFLYITGSHRNNYSWSSDFININIEINNYNKQLYKINGSEWIKFDKLNIESVIDNYIIDYSEKNHSLSIKREIKLRSILKNKI